MQVYGILRGDPYQQNPDELEDQIMQALHITKQVTGSFKPKVHAHTKQTNKRILYLDLKINRYLPIP